MKNKNMVVCVGLAGPPCPRCGVATEVREHKEVTAKELARPFYYTRWFKCTNRRCKTTLVMPEEFKVYAQQPDSGAEGAQQAEPEQASARPTRTF